ncbi:CAMK/CAMKL protein kinase [Cryptococcus deuterogattii 2001/935-1]|nr:CAMK/CAMKL protein kinase [Cryptococcus deuterogattii 2001/935-1]
MMRDGLESRGPHAYTEKRCAEDGRNVSGLSYNSAMSASPGEYTEEDDISASTIVSSGNAIQQQQRQQQQTQPYQLPIHFHSPGEDAHHPNIASVTSGTDDIFSLTDQQLSDRFTFISEIGFGNWGSVWLCKPKHVRSSLLSEPRAVARLGKKAVASGGSGAGGKVAIKLVHRSKTTTTAARVRALWGEMKIIRALRHEPHPSIIQFESFVITPSYALVIMPHLSHLIPVCLPPSRATLYFRQLASAVGYLHERGITHNDIKPANVLLSHNDIPVLVDFGFAQKWDVGARGSFLSSISWGTPEYLDPQRAKGMPHDERASDVWSLGWVGVLQITMFEILTGRTPFEADDQEQFSTPEELVIYYERTRKGHWVGQWSIPSDIETLLRQMINPDPAYRISAMQAYHHPALQPKAPNVIITPHFVRAAASFDVEEEPLPPPPAQTYVVAEDHQIQAKGDTEKEKEKEKKEKRKFKRKTKRDQSATSHDPPPSHPPLHVRATTPALGESIKQHTSVTKLKRDRTTTDLGGSGALSGMSDGKENENEHMEVSAGEEKEKEKNRSKLVIKKLRMEEEADDKDVSGQDPTQNKEAAVLRTMRSLEGTRKHYTASQKEKTQEAFGAIKRPAPEPPATAEKERENEVARPISLDSAQALATEKKKNGDERRSLGLERIGGSSLASEKEKIDKEKTIEKPMALPTSPIFPASDDESPLAELREKIIVSDQVKLVRFGQVSGSAIESGRGTEVVETSKESTAPLITQDAHAHARPDRPTSRAAMPTETHQDHCSSEIKSAPKVSKRASQCTITSRPPSTSGLSCTKSIEALAMDNRLDKMASWIKNVETIIEGARKAVVEGREPGLPVLSLPAELTAADPSTNDNVSQVAVVHRFGVTPDKATAIPSHLRTSSVQVEPATPPKWMTYEEAEERVQAANAWLEEQQQGRRKKERPTVGHVLKLFGGEKEKVVSRSSTSDPDHRFVPLKPPAQTLRGIPSSPALRRTISGADIDVARQSKMPHRKSESNLRNFSTMPVIPSPSFVVGPQYDPDADEDHDTANKNRTRSNTNTHAYSSPRRVRYEALLSDEPGVTRQGEGWTSSNINVPSYQRKEVKPSSSMASLRERARALLWDSRERERHILNLSRKSVSSADGHAQGSGQGAGARESLKVERRSSRLTLRGEKGAKKNSVDHVASNNNTEQPARPNTPAAESVLDKKNGTAGGDKKMKGWVKSLRGAMGMSKA